MEIVEWMKDLEPSVRDHPSMASFKTVGDMAKSWVSAQGMIGAEKLVLPKDEKDEAGWAQVFSKLGRPEQAAGYEVPKVEGFPEGVTIQEERVKAFLDSAHKAGLSQRQVNTIYTSYLTEQAGLFKQMAAQQEAAMAASEKTLRAEWGTGFEAQTALADKTLIWAAGKDSKAIAAQHGNDPAFIRMMAKIGNAISDDVLGPGAPKPGDLTPESARKEIVSIMGDGSHPYHVAMHPEHQGAVEHMLHLHELAYPEPVAR